HKVDEFVNGVLIYQLTVSDYRFPPTLDAKLFERPDGTLVPPTLPQPTPPKQLAAFESAFLAIQKEAEEQESALMATFMKEREAAKNEAERMVAFQRASTASSKHKWSAAQRA